MFGVWLGDGHKADGKITQMNNKVWQEIEHRVITFELMRFISKVVQDLAQTRTVYGLEKELRKLNLLKKINTYLKYLY